MRKILPSCCGSKYRNTMSTEKGAGLYKGYLDQGWATFEILSRLNSPACKTLLRCVRLRGWD